MAFTTPCVLGHPSRRHAGMIELEKKMRYEFKAEFFKVLANPLRIRILDALRDGPQSVGVLRVRLETEQATLSQHLGILRARNFVVTQRRGTAIFYEISDPAIWKLLDSAREIFDNQLVNVRTTLESLRREEAS
jgi:DNA-binding transcriptional ArsR family regulator